MPSSANEAGITRTAALTAGGVTCATTPPSMSAELAALENATVDMEDGCAALAVKGRAEGQCLCRSCKGSAAGWDELTEQVWGSFVTLPPGSGLCAVASLVFSVNEGGHLWKSLNTQFTWAAPYSPRRASFG